MKKGLWFIFIFSVLTACSHASDHNESKDDKTLEYTEEDLAGERTEFGTELYSQDSNQDSAPQEDSDKGKKITERLDRKVIYTADLQIEVKSYQQTLQHIQNQVEQLDGYIVESHMSEDTESGAKTGQITTRVPQAKFQEFITLVEDGSSKVLESSTSGQDVTEEYIDLESRLKSKHVVEDRLLAFMEKANKTEDLLKISSDLAEVQEEIEEITGRMKYLENKSDLATVSIYLQEKNVKLSGTGKEDLNTWEQTQQQFMKSINFLISGFSSLFVFVIGNVPIFLLIGIIGFIVFFIIRKRKVTKERQKS